MGGSPPPPTTKKQSAAAGSAVSAPSASVRACASDEIGCVQSGYLGGLMIPFRYEKNPQRGGAKTAAAAAAELRRELERQGANKARACPHAQCTARWRTHYSCLPFVQIKVLDDGGATTVRARFNAGPLGFVKDEVRISTMFIGEVPTSTSRS